MQKDVMGERIERTGYMRNSLQLLAGKYRG
jgi:hypothetical protein